MQRIKNTFHSLSKVFHRPKTGSDKTMPDNSVATSVDPMPGNGDVVPKSNKKKIIIFALFLLTIALIASGVYLYKIYRDKKVALTVFGTTKYKAKDINTIAQDLKAAGLDDKLVNTFIEDKEKLNYLTNNVPAIKPTEKELSDAKKMFYPDKTKLTTVEEDEVYRNTVFYKYKSLKYGSYLGTVYVFPFDAKDGTDLSNESNAKTKAIAALGGLESNKLSSSDVVDDIFNDSAFDMSTTLPNPSGDFLSIDLSDKTFGFNDINDGIFNHKNTGYSNVEKALTPGTGVEATGAYYFYYIEPIGYHRATSNIDAQISVVVDLLKNVKAQY